MDPLAVCDLEVGQIFHCDLVDGSGRIILPAGRYVSRDLVISLEADGLDHLYRRLRPDQVVTLPALLAEYNSAHVDNLELLLDDGPAILDSIANALQDGAMVYADDVNDVVDSCLDIVREDPSVVLANVMDRSGTESTSQRSLRMSAMTLVGAHAMGFDAEECQQAGRAALLHDISLPSGQPSLGDYTVGTREYDRAVQTYLEHPLASVERLRDNFEGITQLELLLIAQVHEQCDGSGFPRGLKQHLLHPLSRLINLVDAFLTLTEPSHDQAGYAPADALAYLVLHALYGSFDRDCIQALVRAAAIYPVGTQ